MATWFVDVAASPGGDGLSIGTAFNTLSAAASAASSGDIIAPAGGVYRETYAPPAGTITTGDANDRFVISGGEALPGLVPCVAADAAVVGPNWPSMFKATVAKSLFPDDDALSGNLCENGVQMPLSCERADRSDAFFLTKSSYWHTADEVELSGANITGFKLPSMTDGYTKAQLETAKIYFVTEPNVTRQTALVFDEGDDFMRPVGGPFVYENNTSKDNFALFNLPAAARPGEWGFTENGSNVTIYVRPADPASVAAGLIEYAARDIGLHVSGEDDVEVAEFVVRQQGCPSKERCPITVAGSDRVHLHDFSVSDTYSPGNSGYAQIFCRGGDDPHIHHFTLERAQGMFGMFLSGTGASNADWPWLRVVDAVNLPSTWPATARGATSGATVTVTQYSASRDRLAFEPTTLSGTFQDGETITVGGEAIGQYSLSGSDLNNNADPSIVGYDSGGSVHDFDISYTSSSPIRVFTWQNLAIYRGVMRECGRASHANTINFYDQCYNILVWGVNAETADGYATWQESEGIVFAFCAFSASTASSGGHRAIAQQQNNIAKYPGVVFGHLPSAVLNCRTTPFPGRVDDTRYGNGLDATSNLAPFNRWTVYNNLHQGHNGEGFDALDDWDYNMNTQVGGPGAGDIGPNDVTSEYSLNYTDAENGDFTYKADAPVRAFTGKDWSALIPGFKARWPQVPDEVFRTDMLGDAIDWAGAPAGPTVDLDVDYRVARANGPTIPPVGVPGPPKLTGRLLRLSVTIAAP